MIRIRFAPCPLRVGVLPFRPYCLVLSKTVLPQIEKSASEELSPEWKMSSCGCRASPVVPCPAVRGVSDERLCALQRFRMCLDPVRQSPLRSTIPFGAWASPCRKTRDDGLPYDLALRRNVFGREVVEVDRLSEWRALSNRVICLI